MTYFRRTPSNLVAIGLLICCYFFSAGTLLAAEDSRLTWAVNTAPPFHILDGPFAGQGICDSLMEGVESALPERKASQVIMPQTRIGVQFSRDVNQCFPCMIHRPEEANSQVLLSNPTHQYSPHVVITTPRKAQMLRQRYGDPLVLSELLEDNDYRFGYPAGRRYGVLQDVLNSHEGPNSYRVVRTGEYATTAILDMIAAERIDYTIDYPSLLAYHHQSGGEPLAFVRIAENQDQPVTGAIGCTNNAWGRTVIHDINRHIEKIRQHPRFIETLQMWSVAR